MILRSQTKTMSNKFNFALIGAGRIAQSYVDAFTQSATSQLVAIADTDFAAAQTLAAQVPSCQAYSSHEALMRDTDVDACIVCTPPVTHPHIAIDFLKNGVHVLCEKPFSIDSHSAVRMIDAARRNDVQITMASKFRHTEDVAKARDLILSGTIGEVVLFENAFTSRVSMSGRWNAKREISGGGVLIDNGTHSVDLMRFFLGALRSFQVVEGKRSQNLEVEETVRVSVQSVSGVVGSIDLSWSIDKELPGYLNIYGSEGTIVVGWRESKYRTAQNREWTRFGNGYDKVQAFRAQIDNFARGVRGEEDFVVAPTDALASVQAVEAAYEALENSRWTHIASHAHVFDSLKFDALKNMDEVRHTEFIS